MFSLTSHSKSMGVRIGRKGDVIFSKGDPSDGLMFVVLEGEIEEFEESDGLKMVTQKISPGGFFGELEPITGYSRRIGSYQVSSGSVRLGTMDQTAIVKIGAMSPELFLLLLKSSIDQLETAEQRIRDR